MRFHFTTHAVDRYIRRCNPSASRDQAVTALREAAGQAILLQRKTARGDARLWEFPSLGAHGVGVFTTNGVTIITLYEAPPPASDEDLISEYQQKHSARLDLIKEEEKKRALELQQQRDETSKKKEALKKTPQVPQEAHTNVTMKQVLTEQQKLISLELEVLREERILRCEVEGREYKEKMRNALREAILFLQKQEGSEQILHRIAEIYPMSLDPRFLAWKN